MRSGALLRLRVARNVRVVLLPDFLRVDRHLRCERGQRQQHVLDPRLFRRLEGGLILVVERLHGRIVDIDALRERLGVDGRRRHLALLLEQRHEALAGRARDDVRSCKRLLQRREQRFFAHPLLEHRRRHALLREQRPVALGRELALDAERLDLADHARKLRVGHAEPLLARPLPEQSLRHELLDQRESHLGVVEDRGVESAAHRGAHAVLLLAQQVVELGARDLRPAHGRDRGADRVAPEVRVDAEERERDDQQREDDLREASVLVNCFEHREGPRAWRPGLSRERRKGKSESK